VFADPTHGGGYYGGTVSYTTSPYGGINGGGEFTLGGSSFTLPVDQYDPRTHNQTGYGVSTPSIQTFCMERDEYIGSMDIWVSTEFVDGSPGSHACGGGVNMPPSPGGLGDNLDPMTAWLYEQFATGQLQNYDFDNTLSQRKNDAAALQWAIWYIEEEVTKLDTVSKARDYYNMAVTAAPNGIGNVRVLQAYVGDDYKQDQLYYVPVPGAILLGMLGLGAAGLKLRKFA